MADRILLLAGAVALGDTARARQWAHAQLAKEFAWLLDADAPLLVHGGCHDPARAHPRDNPDWWAHELARWARIERRAYMATGLVWSCAAPRFLATSAPWKEDDVPDPKARNVHMARSVHEDLVRMLERAGTGLHDVTPETSPVRVVGLRAPWSKRQGTGHLLASARKADLPCVIEHLCPKEYGGG